MRKGRIFTDSLRREWKCMFIKLDVNQNGTLIPCRKTNKMLFFGRVLFYVDYYFIDRKLIDRDKRVIETCLDSARGGNV